MLFFTFFVFFFFSCFPLDLIGFSFQSTLPLTVARKDVVGRAYTGTGKTMAYLLPLLESGVLERPLDRQRSPVALILVPTRELALQVAAEASKIVPSNVTVATIFGGTSYDTQIDKLRRGTDIVVGTPGRLIDLLDQSILKLDELRTVVLDEADTMLARGFAEDVERILNDAPRPGSRQTLLFSATFPPWVKQLAGQMMHQATLVDLIGSDVGTAKTLKHMAVRVPTSGHNITDEEIERAIADLLCMHGRDKRVIVFAPTKQFAGELSMSPALVKFGARALHGDMTQQMRTQTMTDFRDNDFQILVATDVAARGLDVPAVDVVVQLASDCGKQPEMYVHRAGRAGRAGRPGLSLLMFTDGSRHDMQAVESFCKMRFEEAVLPQPRDAMREAGLWTIEQLSKSDAAVAQFYVGMAEQALAQHGPSIFGAAIARLSGFSRVLGMRSLLSGSLEHVTVRMTSQASSFSGYGKPGLYAKQIYAHCEDICKKFGQVASCTDTDGVLVDVPAEHLELVTTRLAAASPPIAVEPLTELPAYDKTTIIHGISRFIARTQRRVVERDDRFRPGSGRDERFRGSGGRDERFRGSSGRDFRGGDSFSRRGEFGGRPSRFETARRDSFRGGRSSRSQDSF